MRAVDVVAQLALKLPLLTPLFTNEVPVASLTRSGAIVTATCLKGHGLRPGDAVAIVGAKTPISISSLTRSTTTGTLVTATDHDRTHRPNPGVITALSKTVTISGATEAEFNGTFNIIQVVNRRTITFTTADSGATTATGSPIFEDGESALRDYNATRAVLEVPDPATFTFTFGDATIPDPIGTIVARTKPRISTAVSATRVAEAYTKKGLDELWLFAVLGDVSASKDRAINSDASSNLQRGNEFRQQVIQPFTLYLLSPSTTSIGGREPRDQAEDLFQSICRSVLFTKFDSRLTVGATQGPVQFTSHGTFLYDTAFYMHEYNFEAVVDLVFEDTVGPDLDVAFRDVDLSLFPDLDLDAGTGIESLTATFSLDDVPL